MIITPVYDWKSIYVHTFMSIEEEEVRGGAGGCVSWKMKVVGCASLASGISIKLKEFCWYFPSAVCSGDSGSPRMVCPSSNIYS